MAGKRQRRRKDGMSPVVAMLFGLAVGLSVAAAVYVSDRRPKPGAGEPATTAGGPVGGPVGGPSGPNRVAAEAAPTGPNDNHAAAVGGPSGPNRIAAEAAPTGPNSQKRFTFYDILPNFEVVTKDEAPAASAGATPQAIVEPGVYVLQAGSFSTHADADRRRAELALHGIESHIQRVKVNDRNYHRVYIGPTEDLDELNMLRSRLRAAEIDVLRIRLGD
ncbi:MAG: SPOR domain-containing protein [Proteobacteria bacterium]|nr:SPOR domain-containing protein [Pseudomonadota bacterium]